MEMSSKLAGLVRQAGNVRHQDERLALLGMLGSGSRFDVQEIAGRVGRQFAGSPGHGPAQNIAQRLAGFLRASLIPYMQAHGLLAGSRISTRHGNYLTGDWFEEWVWGRICAALPHLQEHIYYNLKLMDSGTDPALPRADFELDIAIYAGNQLHCFECKNKKKGADEALDRLHAAKRRFLGPYGRASLFWARSMAPDAHSRAIARASGIGLYAGFGEIEQEIERLGTLFADG